MLKEGMGILLESTTLEERKIIHKILENSEYRTSSSSCQRNESNTWNYHFAYMKAYTSAIYPTWRATNDRKQIKTILSFKEMLAVLRPKFNEEEFKNKLTKVLQNTF